MVSGTPMTAELFARIEVANYSTSASYRQATNSRLRKHPRSDLEGIFHGSAIEGDCCEIIYPFGTETANTPLQQNLGKSSGFPQDVRLLRP
jgi:hypothetical protein